MARHVLAERTAFARRLRETDPSSPTLCGEWNAAQLTAHLVLRERSLVELGGRLPVARLQRRAHSAVDAYAARFGYSELIDQFEYGPPRWSAFGLPPVREAVNLLEYMVHHEDVRRAVPDFRVRILPPGDQAAAWSRLRFTARITLRQVPQGVRLVSPEHGALDAPKAGAPLVTVTGEPVELALVIMGRQRVAQVTYDGPAGDVASFSGARIAI
jgi:uncharacterized protein (TIGR03085 family)